MINSLQAEPGFVLGTLHHETLAVGVKRQLVVSKEAKALSVDWQAEMMTPNIPEAKGVGASTIDRGVAAAFDK